MATGKILFTAVFSALTLNAAFADNSAENKKEEKKTRRRGEREEKECEGARKEAVCSVEWRAPQSQVEREEKLERASD